MTASHHLKCSIYGTPGVALMALLALACTQRNPRHHLEPGDVDARADAKDDSMAPLDSGQAVDPGGGTDVVEAPPLDASAAPEADPVDSLAGEDAPPGPDLARDTAPEPDAAPDSPPADTTPATSEGLVLHWRFDDESGAVVASDSSGSGLDGTYVGNPPPARSTEVAPTMFPNPASRQFGAALNHSVRLPYSSPALKPSAGLTVSVWFRVTATTARSDLVCHGTDYLIRYFADGLEFIRRPAGSGPGSVSAQASAPGSNDGMWHHAAGVATGTDTRLYFDGREIDRDVDPVPLMYTGDSVSVGRSVAGNQNFEGWLDDVRIYNRALSDAEVQALAGRAP